MKAWILVLGAIAIAEANFRQAQYPYTWICEDKRCLRKLKSGNATGTPMEVCKLNCDDIGSLWPKPTGEVSVGKELVSLYPANITFDSNQETIPEPVRPLMGVAFTIFQNYITKLHPEPYPGTGPTLQHLLQISVNIKSATTEIGLSTDESYNLTLTKTTEGSNTIVKADIEAVTFFGARHALETLSQLIAYDDVNTVLQVVSTAKIVDKPVFKYRGVMLDTSRNFFSIDKLKGLIDGMSYNKLNMFHWHITDSYTFPMEVPRQPNMTIYGVYSPEKVYRKTEIQELVDYAKQRGVKVIPELDQPAHSGYGYQWGKGAGLDDLVVCVESEPWYNFCVQPPCGQLNIVNPNVENVIGDIFTDMMGMFDKDVFHMGGDEVDFRCYNSTKSITDYMLANNFTLETEDFFRLWGNFQEKALGKLLNATSNNNTQVILWTSGLTNPQRIENYLDKSRYIIQIWSASNDPAIGGLLEKGYKTIFSNVDALYLDCGMPAWLGDGHNWCSPIKGWQTIYDNDPQKIYAKFADEAVAAEAVRSGQIVGSETPLWAEQVDDKALESRMWPRAAALAERLWTHPTTNHSEAQFRMVTNRNRMVVRGIKADRLQPEFCSQYEGKCYAEVPQTGPGTTENPGTTSPGVTTTPTTTSSQRPGTGSANTPYSANFSPAIVAIFLTRLL